MGFTVGKVLGGAVERNRIKRRMREAVRLSPTACEGPMDIVFNPRKSVLTLPFAELVSEVARALRLAAQRARVAEAKMKQAMQFVLRGYKRLISPMLPHSCRFVPTCSEYAMEAVERHGAVRGSCWHLEAAALSSICAGGSGLSAAGEQRKLSCLWLIAVGMVDAVPDTDDEQEPELG